MKLDARERFILTATLGYALGALAWIFLSDQLLGLVVEKESLLLLSNTKGVFFVFCTAALLFLALRAVPARAESSQGNFAEVLASGVLAGRNSPWLIYGFSIVISVSVLFLRQSLVANFVDRPMLNLFMLPIMLSAFFGGLGPGLLATAIVGTGSAYLAFGQNGLEDVQDRFLLGLLLFNGVAISLLCELLQRSMLRQRRNQRLLSSVVSGTTDAIFVKDLQGRYLLFNQAASTIAGISATDVLGRDDLALFPEKTAQQVLIRDREVLARGQTQTHEEALTMPDGQARVFLVTKGPVSDEAGKVCGLFGIARDITLLRSNLRALQSSEAALREAQELAGIGRWRWDFQHDEHEWSEQLYRISGRDPALPPPGYPDVQQYFTQEDWAVLDAQVELIRAQGGCFERDVEILRGDGSRRWATYRAEEIRDADGLITGVRGTLQDITDRKTAELNLQVSEQRLQLVIGATADGVWDWDLRSGYVYRSPRYYELTLTRAEEDSHDFAFFQKLVNPDDLPEVLQRIRAHQQDVKVPLEFDFRLTNQAAGERWLRGRGRVMTFDAQGQPARMVGTLADITERKTAELALRQADTVFENSYEGIMVVSPLAKILKVNPAFTRITGYLGEEVIGQTPKMLSSGRHDQTFYAEMWATVGQQGFWRGEIWNRRKNGEIYAEQLTITVVRDAKGDILYYIGAFSDISQIKAHESELDRIAHYDPLTGTPNRRLLGDRLAQSINRTSRSDNSLAVCFLDLDGFKAVNDQYGHAAGDQLLVGITENLKHVMRADDTLARLGGDEFVLLLMDLPSLEECSQILERILGVIARPILIEGRSISITASIGVSLYPQDNVDADTLLRHADQAMYLAKESGKNHYQLFDPESDRRAQSHRLCLEELRHALENHEFVLYYQPKIDLRTGSIVGVEALIRWQHPQRGLVSPAEFLPHIYGSNLEKPIGEWVIDAALAQALAWRLAGVSLVVSVNVSANHLLQADFRESLQCALARYPELPASTLELEVLETAAIADMDHAVTVLHSCRALGVHFALDDFGTGYSSLTYLRKLPVDTLKIDQSFVRDMLESADDLGIVEGVIRMAAVFDRQVIAEGVETLEHAAALLRLGCVQAQGYGIARPMAAVQFPGWAQEWQNQTAWHSLASRLDLPEDLS